MNEVRNQFRAVTNYVVRNVFEQVTVSQDILGFRRFGCKLILFVRSVVGCGKKSNLKCSLCREQNSGAESYLIKYIFCGNDRNIIGLLYSDCYRVVIGVYHLFFRDLTLELSTIKSK